MDSIVEVDFSPEELATIDRLVSEGLYPDRMSVVRTGLELVHQDLRRREREAQWAANMRDEIG